MTKPESEGGLGITVGFTDEKTTRTPPPQPKPTISATTTTSRCSPGSADAHEATMTQDEYDRFRAVHDVFGHAAVGGGFDRHGEYQAYLMHSSMYWGDGRRAMATEYHGVNTADWGGDPGTPGTGKSILLPEELIPNPWSPDGVLVMASAPPQDCPRTATHPAPHHRQRSRSARLPRCRGRHRRRVRPAVRADDDAPTSHRRRCGRDDGDGRVTSYLTPICRWCVQRNPGRERAVDVQRLPGRHPRRDPASPSRPSVPVPRRQQHRLHARPRWW